MTVYYVFQGITYEKERAGGYVWSPQLDKRGGKNAGYLRMTQIKKGDFKIVGVGKIDENTKFKPDWMDW